MILVKIFLPILDPGSIGQKGPGSGSGSAKLVMVQVPTRRYLRSRTISAYKLKVYL
jgi:hypothetical protein